HRSTLCEIVATSKMRSNRHRVRAFTRMNIEKRIGVVRWNWSRNGGDARRHGEISKKLQKNEGINGELSKKLKEEDEDCSGKRLGS
ncbi:hypothetical protein A2U01_0075366, partial [Trifolium medium]|nr:hypothetical protein [Trifolium medium]